MSSWTGVGAPQPLADGKIIWRPAVEQLAVDWCLRIKMFFKTNIYLYSSEAKMQGTARGKKTMHA
jgi:hypothetical protein